MTTALILYLAFPFVAAAIWAALVYRFRGSRTSAVLALSFAALLAWQLLGAHVLALALCAAAFVIAVGSIFDNLHKAAAR